MAETREERLEKLRASYNRWKNASAGSYNYADYDKEAAARIEALRAVYNQQFLPQQANKWARDASDFAKKISADAQARSKGYQSPDSLKAYQDSISPQLSDLIGRAKYAQQYAGLNNDAEYGKGVNDTLSYLNSIGKSLQNEQAYWAQWANEDAYKKSGNYYNDTYGEDAKGYKAVTGRTMASMGDAIVPADTEYTQAAEIYKLYSGRDYLNDTLSIAVGGGSGANWVENYIPLLDQNERSLYLWLYDKEGKEKADEYLRSMHDTLAYRAGEAVSKNIDNMSGGNQATRDVLNALYALPAGVNAWANGLMQAGAMLTGQTLAVDPWAVAHSLNREKGSDVGNVFSDLSYTFGNMAPSMAIGAATGSAIAGDIALGLSSAGNSYADAKREGYDQGQAMVYGLVNGTLEAGMQYLLGGISNLGGKAASKLSKHATSYLSKLSNAGARAVLQTGGKLLTSMGSEATEEYLQSVLDPLVRNIILGEDNDFWAGFTSEDALYSALLGALSAGLLEGPGIITSAAEANKIGKRAFENGSWEGAVDYAMQLDPESEPYKLAKALRDGTIKADGNNVGNLYTSLSEYMAESKKLVRKGKMTTDQYTSTAAAIDTIYKARLAAQQQSTPAAAETATGTDIPSVLNNDIYQEVKAVETDGKAAVREANIIARIADGDKSVTGSQIDSVVNTNAKTREIVSSRLGVDLGNTNAEARRAVKQYMDTVSATKAETTANAQTETANTAPKTEEETRVQAVRQEADAITKTMGTEGQSVYKQFTANMKLGDSLVYATEAMFRFYNQGVNAENSKHPSKKFRDIPGYEGISAEMKQAAYNAGRVDVQAKSGSIAEIVTKTKETAEKAAQQQAEIKKNAKASKVNIKELAPSAGKWSVDPKIDMDTLTSKQTAAVSYLKAVSEVSGMNITLMSGVDATGAFSVENGHYDGVTNTLYVSVNAGMQSITDITGSAILKTASHEITHYIAASGTQTYSLLEDYVLSRFTEQYGEKSVDNRIEDIQEQYKDQVGKELTREQAKEEMVAAACEMMLKNSEVFEKLARQNLTLAQRIKAGLDGFIKKLSANRKAAFENLDATSPEARAIAASETSLKETQKLWDNALKGAIKENQRVSDSQVNSSTTEMQNPDVMQNLRTMTEDYWAYRNDAVLKGLLTKQEYDDLFNTINVIMDKARNNPDILDFGADIESENRPFSAVKPNSDPLYKVSLDFSTLCRKRLLQQAIVNKLQSKLKRSLTATEQTQIRNELVKLRKEGKKIEVACALCYVEAARLKSPDVINDFLENRRKYAVDYFSKKNKEFNKLIEKQQGDYLASQNIKRNAKKSEMPKTAVDYLNTNKPVWRQQYKPSVSEEAAIKILVDMDAAELLSAQGLARLRLANPVAYDIYISRVRTATKSKAQETNMPFKRGDTYGFIDGNGRKTTVISNALIAAMNAENGLRYQSWSDFQAMHILDNIAAVMELSTRKAKMQTYTKVPDFVMLNGKTGMMINMSLLAQGNGFSETGGFAFDPYEGMPFKEMQRLRDMFPETAGNIVVGVSDEHVRALLASKDIDYVIPYHLSGLNENLRSMMSIEAWVDYTRTQGEKFNGKENSGGAKNWHKAPRFGEWFDAVAAAQAKDGYAFMQEAAQKYLNLCEERGLVPKFEEFKNEANYWKLLIDRKMVNQETGKVIIQQAVKPIFDENAIAVANNAIQDEQAIKDFREVQDSLVKQITSGKIEISKRMTAELAAMYNAPYVSGIEGQNNSKMYELRGYSEKEVNSWANSKRIIIYRDNIQLEEFINEALNNKNYDRKMYFGKIPANLAEDIRNILAKDIDVEGYNCALDSYHIRKINASHGNEVNERLLGQRGVTVNDYETIPSVISNPDSLTDQGLYNGKPAIGFVKYINGEKFTVIGVISDKHMDLFVQTSYIGAKKGSLSTRASEKTDTITPEARRGTAPDNNIADSTDAVNTLSPDIRYQLREVTPVEPSSEDWTRSLTTAEAKKRFPDLWDVSAEESDTRNPTQVKITESSYRKIYDILKQEGFDGTILDASSGLGHGTRVGIEDYGFKVDDIEPYPSKDYSPKYTDYSKLDKTYDAIISNAVLNVLPQDQRDALVVKMGQMLNPGGQMFINVRGDDVLNASSKEIINRDNLEVYITKSGSYQKGFTRKELVAYLQDALGDGYTVRADNRFGKVSAVVTKAADTDVRFELRSDENQFNPRKELSNLFMQIAQNEQEKKSLRSYQAAIHELNNTEIEISKLQQEMQGTDKLKSPQKYYELQNKLRQAEAKLNRYDGRLVQLEATKPMKDLIARREQRLKEQFARSSTTRAKYRNNIKKNIRSLDKKLRTNSGQKHVLLELQPVVAQLLNVFTENTSVFKKEQLAKLREIYAKFNPEADSKISSNEKEVTRWKSTAEYSSAYSEMIYDLIEEVRPLVQGKRLIDLDTELLAAVNDIVSNINKMVNRADEMFIAGRAESLREISENTLRDMENSGYGQKRNPRAETNKTVQSAKAFFSYKNAMPVYVFERLGDTAVEKLWDPLQAAAGKKAREEVADREYWQGLRRKYNHKSWDNNGRLVQLESGRKIYLTPQEAMSIYALDKREATHRTVGGKNIKHLQGGGISFPEAAKITVKDANGKTRTEYRLATSGGMRLTEGDIKTIGGLLTQEQRAYADDVVKYLSTTIADRGNAVSRELYGINIFNESYYFPITVDKTFLQQSITGQADKLIKNAGMTKSLTQDASKPVYVMDFDRIVAQHLLQMEGYDTLSVPLDNFQRWLRYQSFETDAKGKRTYNDKTVSQTLKDVYGKEMQEYISNFLTDVNAASSRATNDGLLDKAIGVFKKNAVLASLSVAIQQPSAIGRALLYIDPKYFVGEGALTSWSKANLEEMMKYSDAAFIKENGAFDPAVSRGALEKMLYEEPETVKEKIKALISRDSTYRDNIAGWLPGVMDSITWRTLWMAIKNETADAHPELSRTSEEFLQIAGKRMDYVVNRTQVYDSMLTKSELMRSKSALMKMTTAFMNEPTTAYNMLYHAAEKLAVAKGTAKKAAAKHLARAVAAFVTATAFNALLKSLVTAARKDNPDDEDDKTYIEWYAGEVVGNFFDDLNPIKLLPVLRDVFSLIEGYDVERSDMESISKLIDAGKAIVDGNASLDKKLEKLLIAVGVATGIPLENLIRDTKGLRNVIMDIADGWQTTAEGVGNAAKSGLPFAEEDEGSINDKLFRAYMNQDETAIKRYEQAVTERFNKKKSAGGYKSYDSAEYYIRKEMRSRLAHTEEIKAVYDAAAAGDLQAYKAAVKALTDRGFQEIDVLDAKRTYANNLKKAAETPVQDTTATEQPEEEAAVFDSAMFTAALENNDGTDRQIIEQQLEGLAPRSEEYKDKAAKLKSRITAYLKPKYQDAFLANDTATMLRISRQLQTYRQYGIVYNAEILTQWRKAARTDRK